MQNPKILSGIPADGPLAVINGVIATKSKVITRRIPIYLKPFIRGEKYTGYVFVNKYNSIDNHRQGAYLVAFIKSR